jgi:RNA-directed DNA polymerase
LRLKVNQGKRAVARPKRHFLGFSLRREPRDGAIEVLLSDRSRQRIRNKVRELTPRSFGQSLEDCIERLNVYLVGWIAFFFPCTEAEQFTIHGLDAHIRRRLRAIVLRHCKRRRHIVQRLTSLGVQRSAATTDVYNKGHRSLWALSACFSVHRALGIRFFEERKLVSLAERWRKLRAQHDIASAQLTLPLR